jgi:hypothetical protein
MMTTNGRFGPDALKKRLVDELITADDKLLEVHINCTGRTSWQSLARLLVMHLHKYSVFHALICCYANKNCFAMFSKKRSGSSCSILCTHVNGMIPYYNLLNHENVLRTVIFVSPDTHGGAVCQLRM